LDAAFDFPHGLQILRDARPIGSAQLAFQTADLIADRVQDAALLFDAGQPLFGRGSIAKQAIEDHTRIDLHRQRRGRGAPRDGVHVGATETHIARTN